MTATLHHVLSSQHIAQFHDEGYTVVRGLVSAERIPAMIEHYMELRGQGPKPGDMGGDPRNAKDPLNRFPRFINQHTWDDASKQWCNDAAIVAAASEAIGQQAVLNQTMLYFKPPGARGQAMHQDQQYITIDPLIGVWVALDPADRENGGMVVVPRSHRRGLLPVSKADTSVSFVGGGTEIPADLQELGIDLAPGDALLFGGGIIHGSHPNTTTDRFRRSFICHFVGAQALAFVPPPGTNMRHLAP